MEWEKQTEDKRRERLRLWLKANGGPRSVCVSRGLAKSVETRISNVLKGNSFGSRGARSLEAKLGIEIGHLEGVGEISPPLKAQGATAPVATGLSAQAADLGHLLDMLPDLIARSEAYSQCSKIIIDSLRSSRDS